MTAAMMATALSRAEPLPPPPGPAPALPTATRASGSPAAPSRAAEPAPPFAAPAEPSPAPQSRAPEAAAPPPSALGAESAAAASQRSGGAKPPEVADASVDNAPPSSATPVAPPSKPSDAEARRARLRYHSNWRGSTGLLRTHAAATGPTGSFRFGLVGGYFGARGFLCPQCISPDGGPADIEDEVSRAELHVQISASIRPYLEAYFGLHSSATSNDRGNPELLQVLGDTSWGLKAFMPQVRDGLFTAGGAFELWLLNGSGGVGVGGASVALRGLASVDFTNRSDVRARIPLRIHGNLSYVFDNSSELIEDVEAARRARISRIERFGLNINRVDRLVPAVGVEGLFEYVHPFVEFSIDIPSNLFKNYECARRSVAASDICLIDRRSVVATPSRLTLGARGYALLDGLSALLAFDVGLGGVAAPFWDEMRPEAPWNLWFGVSYAVDPEPRVVVQPVRVPTPPEVTTELYGVRGRVVTAKGESPIAGARVLFQGHNWNGFVTNAQGDFQTPPLEPGAYTLQIEADGYYDDTCSVLIDAALAVELAKATKNAVDAPRDTREEREGASSTGPWSSAALGRASDRLRWTSVTCELSPKPQVGNLAGNVLDASTQEPIAKAQVSVSDVLGRTLALLTNELGAYRFENVIPGQVTVHVQAEDYLPTAVVLEMGSRKEVAADVRLSRVPEEPSFVVQDASIRLERPIAFAVGRAELEAQSLPLVDELALLLQQRPDIQAVELRLHAPPGADLSLHRERAARLRQALIHRGVDASRVQSNADEATSGSPSTTPNEPRLEIIRKER